MYNCSVAMHGDSFEWVVFNLLQETMQDFQVSVLQVSDGSYDER